MGGREWVDKRLVKRYIRKDYNGMASKKGEGRDLVRQWCRTVLVAL